VGRERSFDPERHVWFTTREPKRNERAKRNRWRINELRLARVLTLQDFLIGEEADLATEYGVFAARSFNVLDTLNDGGTTLVKFRGQHTRERFGKGFPDPGGLPRCPSRIS
jgi:hypothetical protein